MSDNSSIAVAQQSTAITSPTVDLFSDKRIELIRNTIAKDAPQDVFVAMVELAKTRGLDPLAKQISAIKFGNVWQVTTTIDGYRALAEQTGRYAGSDEPVFSGGGKLTNGKSHPGSASVTVWKLVGGTRYPFTATVYWEEYNAGRANWLTMPRTMLAKVAEAHALRKAFPSVLSGIHTPDEMDQAAVETTGRVQSPSASAAPSQVDRDRAHVLESLRERGARVGWTEDHLVRWARSRDFDSLNLVPVASLRQLSNWFETHPDDARRVAEGRRQEAQAVTSSVIEAEVREVQREVDPETGEILPEEFSDEEWAAFAEEQAAR